MQIQRNKKLRIAFWTVIVLGFLFCAVVPEWLRASAKRDRLEATPQWGVATVVTQIAPGENNSGLSATPSAMTMSDTLVQVRFRGKIYNAREVSGFSELRTEKPAQIMYRIGKSGRVYVDLVQPLPSAAQSSLATH